MTGMADEVIQVLSPVIGQGLAESAVTLQCRKLGILPENLSGENIEEFSLHFKKMMAIFAGEQVADEIITRIKTIDKKTG
ncbi:MAG: hypothetical protein WC379_15630 [Methanoregula sp.]|jgi:hypothetical protein